MNRKYLILVVLVLTASLITSCSDTKPLKPDTPVNALMITELEISSNDYDDFNSLFIDGRKNTISKKTLMEFSKLHSGAYDSSFYGLITYSNGEMLLVNFTPKKIDGEYKVQNVIKVPEEMKKLFEVK